MLQEFWFALIVVLWTGFFVLEGFDFGVGMLSPLIGRTEDERETAIRTIGPVWDGNEVWLIVAGGATFAAFPVWYASMFSGFYLAFALLLAGLIVRGIGIEYRGKAATESGRRWAELGLGVGSFLAALLLGVAFADFVRGFQMNADHDITGGFLDLLSPYSVLGGLVSLSMFLAHGAVFLGLRTEGAVRARAAALAPRLAAVALVLAAVFVVWTTRLRGGVVSWVVGALFVVALVAALAASRARREGLAFTATAVATACLPVFVFACLWPTLLPARNSAAYSLTVSTASSSHYTLVVMTVVALVMTPIVLVYEGWAYWVFRARVTGRTPDTAGPAARVAAAVRAAGSAGPTGAAGADGR